MGCGKPSKAIPLDETASTPPKSAAFSETSQVAADAEDVAFLAEMSGGAVDVELQRAVALREDSEAAREVAKHTIEFITEDCLALAEVREEELAARREAAKKSPGPVALMVTLPSGPRRIECAHDMVARTIFWRHGVLLSLGDMVLHQRVRPAWLLRQKGVQNRFTAVVCDVYPDLDQKATVDVHGRLLRYIYDNGDALLYDGEGFRRFSLRKGESPPKDSVAKVEQLIAEQAQGEGNTYKPFRTLKLHDLTLTPAMLESVFASLGHFPLEPAVSPRLTLIRCHLSEGAVQCLRSAKDYVSALYISDCQVATSLKPLYDSLTEADSFVKRLDLVLSDRVVSDMSDIAWLIRYKSNIDTLAVCRAVLDAQGVDLLLSALKDAPTLQRFIFLQISFTSPELARLFAEGVVNIIRHNIVMSGLEFKFCRSLAGNAFFSSVAGALAENPSLTEIRIELNGCGDDAALAMALAMQSNTNLQKVFIREKISREVVEKCKESGMTPPRVTWAGI